MIARSLAARSYCKYAVNVTPTFTTLQRNRGSRAQTHKNSMVSVIFCHGLAHDRQASSGAADVQDRCLLLRQARCLLLRQDRCLLLRQDRYLLLRQDRCLLVRRGAALSHYFTSVLSQQKTSVLSQQQTSVLSQQQTSASALITQHQHSESTISISWRRWRLRQQSTSLKRLRYPPDT